MPNMKVLLVAEQCNPDWPSVPLVAFNIFNELRKQVSVTLVTHVRNRAGLGARCPEADIHYVEESKALAAWYKVANRLSTIRGSTIWPLFHTLTYPVYASYNNKVAEVFGKRVQAGEWDCVHALTPMMPRYPYEISKHCTNVPFVIGPVNGGVPYPKGFAKIARSEYAQFNVLRRLGRLVLRDYARTYQRVDHVFSGSRYTQDMLASTFGISDRIDILAENGLDDTAFTHLRRTAPRDKLELLFVGRLVPYKGADVAIDAVAKLPYEIRRRVRLTIVGDGPERQRLATQAAALNLQDEVRFTGWVPHTEISSTYAAADVFCFPSIREFGGAVVLEAMAAGLPCIVVDNGGVGEYVTAEAGFKITPRSREGLVSEFASHIERLFDPSADYLAMSHAAQSRAWTYLWRSKADAIVKTYERLLKAQRPAAEHVTLPSQSWFGAA